MSSRQHLIVEMELVHTLSKLTPEERKVEVRRQMYVELKAVEMERRQRAALETLAKSERDGEESLQKVNMETDRRKGKTAEPVEAREASVATGKTAEVRETLQSMQKDRLSVEHWVGKYQQNHEKKREKRRLKAEAQHEEYIASKSHGPQQSVLDELLD
ncbi:hypothetical protein JOQ06_014773 [Pogonophryne albipinna]|uniref:Uncharacterized protein n=1 Tax=Pogonophryne albipinna TaxID=1090488 RepID=A0AAD6AKX5_9TELE|nr:hypothetical protein JOQ06_014773 [Pogonophryne albipinna]